MVSWKKVRLGDISEIIGGGTPSTNVPRFWGGDIAWLTPKDLSKYGNRYISKGERNITEEGLKNCSSKLLPQGTILLTSRAPIGYLAIAKMSVCTNQGFKSIVLKGKHKSEFFYYLLKNNIEHIKRNASGSTFAEISGTQVKNLIFNVPEYSVQVKIADVLSALDDKIELNNQINERLDKMVKDLYNYWFVQFEFPNKEGKPYKSSGGEMLYNEVLKRELPAGWRNGVFADFIDTEKSGDWGKENIQANYSKAVYCIRGADFPALQGKEYSSVPLRYISLKNTDKALKENNVIIEISGGSPTQSTGRICYINKNIFNRFSEDIIVSNFCKAIVLKNKKALYNFYLTWQNLYDANVMFLYEGKTTGIKNLLFDIFVNSYSILLPSDEIVENFYTRVAPIFERIQFNISENNKLAELRDFLLPMLMNGQVEVVE